MTEYSKRRQEESQEELVSVIKKLMAWHARQRRKLMLFVVSKWVGLLLLLATVLWVMT